MNYSKLTVIPQKEEQSPEIFFTTELDQVNPRTEQLDQDYGKTGSYSVSLRKTITTGKHTPNREILNHISNMEVKISKIQRRKERRR